MEPLADLDDLIDRLDWTLDEDETRIAKTALEDLSDDARHYGRESWTTPATTPRMVSKMVLRAAVRYMRNPDGYTTSRAGDETLNWNEDRTGQAGSAHFNDREIKAFRQIAGATGIVSVPIYAFSKGRASGGPGWVSTGFTGTENKPFPMFADDTEPW